MFLLEREFGVKTESVILSLLNILVQMQSLTVGSPLATHSWKMRRLIMYLSYSCFCFALITSHYLRQGGPFDVTYVANFTLFIYGKENTQKSKHSEVFCTSECLTGSSGVSSCLRLNGFCLWEMMTKIVALHIIKVVVSYF